MYQNSYFDISKKWKKKSYKSIKTFQKKVKEIWKKKKHVIPNRDEKIRQECFLPVNMIFHSKHLEFFF